MGGASDGLTTISFDGDGTLWDFRKVMRHSLGHTLAELRRLAPSAAVGWPTLALPRWARSVGSRS